MGAFRRQRHEIPEGVVSRSRLWNFVVWLGLDRMDQVGKLDCVLDEEHRHIVADEVPDPFVGIKLDREAAHVASAVSRPAGAARRSRIARRPAYAATGRS